MLWPPDAKSWLGKDPDAGKDWGQEKKGTTEDEMVGWHHWLNRYEFKLTPGDSERQGSLQPMEVQRVRHYLTTEQQHLTKLNMHFRVTWKLHPLVFIPEKWKLIFTLKNCTHVHSSFIHNRPKLETMQISFNGWTKLWYIHLWNTTQQKEWTVDTCNNLDRSQEKYGDWKNDKLRCLYTIWFHLYNIFEMIKWK